MRTKILSIAASCLLALPAGAATFIVDSTADATDVLPGDGICATEGDECTLRAAIVEANALAGDDAVDLTGIADPRAPIQLSIDGVDETPIENPLPDPETPYVVDDALDASIGDLDITENLVISGAGSALTVIEWSEASRTDGDPATGDRVFQVRPTDTDLEVTISGLTVRNGSVGIPPSEDPGNPYNLQINGDGSIWQFRRLGGGVALGNGAAIVLYVPVEHGGGGAGEGGGGKGPFPGGTGEGEEGGSILGVTLDDVRIASNASGADGGGLFNAAPTLLRDSAISGNVSGTNGGGIYNDEALEIADSTIGAKTTVAELSTGNDAEGGGGLFDTGSHLTVITGSSFVNNSAVGGGGIAGRTGVTIDVANSTFSGNAAFDTGGGITTNGTVTLRNVTITGNSASSDPGFGGGGINSFGSGTFTLVNTLLSANTMDVRAANCGCTGGSCTAGNRIVSQGFNLEDADSCGFTLASDLVNTDPLLLALADNGGLTETHDLVIESPAVDAGSQVVCDALVLELGADRDQRGGSRSVDGDGDESVVCDIGAVEFAPEPGATGLASVALGALALALRARRGAETSRS